jgi:dolichol kinase
MADPAAALIGGSVGKTTYDLSGPKSGEGTLAFFIVSLAVLSISLAMLGVYVPLGPIVLASIFCAASEGLLGRGKDNLVLPTVAAFAVSLLV